MVVGQRRRGGLEAKPVLLRLCRAAKAAHLGRTAAHRREAGSAADLEFWDRVMGERDQRESDLAHAIHLIRATGAAERTLETARMEAAAARAALARAARGPCHDERAGLADQSVNRAF
jgi:hypothetical protein